LVEDHAHPGQLSLQGPEGSHVGVGRLVVDHDRMDLVAITCGGRQGCQGGAGKAGVVVVRADVANAHQSSLKLSCAVVDCAWYFACLFVGAKVGSTGCLQRCGDGTKLIRPRRISLAAMTLSSPSSDAPVDGSEISMFAIA